MRTIFFNSLKPLLYISVVVCCMYFSYHTGYVKGVNKGFCAALDTVNKICVKQVNSDTTVSKIVLIDRDTTAYFLSRKTVIER